MERWGFCGLDDGKRLAVSATYTFMPSGQVSDFRDMCLLIRHKRLVCGSCLSDQRFAFSFLPTTPRDDAVAVQLTLPPDGCVEDLTSTKSVESHLQVGAPCRAHAQKRQDL
jgi:hypothetical protein